MFLKIDMKNGASYQTTTLIAQRIFNCIFYRHSYAYKVSDFDNYDWKRVFIENLKNYGYLQVLYGYLSLISIASRGHQYTHIYP